MMERPGPKWVENDADEEMWGAAVGYGVNEDVLKSRIATAAFVRSKSKSLKQLSYI
jgi:endonuclease III